MSNDYLLVGIDTTYNDNEIELFISNINEFDQSYDFTIYQRPFDKFKQIPLKFNNSKTCEEVSQIISELEQNQIISYSHFMMQTDNCYGMAWEPIGDLCVNSYGSDFHVKVFDENDLSNLNQVISQTNTELVGQFGSLMPKWFHLRATKLSKGDALEMANFFHETGLFEHSEPAEITKYAVE